MTLNLHKLYDAYRKSRSAVRSSSELHSNWIGKKTWLLLVLNLQNVSKFTPESFTRPTLHVIVFTFIEECSTFPMSTSKNTLQYSRQRSLSTMDILSPASNKVRYYNKTSADDSDQGWNHSIALLNCKESLLLIEKLMGFSTSCCFRGYSNLGLEGLSLLIIESSQTDTLCKKWTILLLCSYYLAKT